jgi:hypothetical protein
VTPHQHTGTCQHSIPSALPAPIAAPVQQIQQNEPVTTTTYKPDMNKPGYDENAFNDAVEGKLKFRLIFMVVYCIFYCFIKSTNPIKSK